MHQEADFLLMLGQLTLSYFTEEQGAIGSAYSVHILFGKGIAMCMAPTIDPD